MNGKVGVRWVLILLGVVALVAIGLTIYAPSRPQLAAPDQSARLQQLQKKFTPIQETNEEPDRRAQRAQLREFLLDYPQAKEPKLQIGMAGYFIEGEDADFDYVAEQVEQIAADVLTKFGPGQTPTQQDFEAVGFPIRQELEWTPAYSFADVDNDGSKDIVFSIPGGGLPSICYLFRHTTQGWKSHRLVVGTAIMGVWVFDIEKGGPKVIEIGSLADNAYDPNLLVDAFVWQTGGIRSVLATKIPHGFQLDHKDVDGKGVQAIRLFGNETTSEVRTWDRKPNVLQTYRWDGTKFALNPTQTLSSHSTVPWLQRSRQLFEAGKFEEAAQVLQKGISAPPTTDYSYEDELHQGWYTLGLCRAFLGDRDGARKAMSRAAQKVNQDNNIRADNAGMFLGVCSSPSAMPQALGAIGQGFRVIEETVRSHSNATPKAVMMATGLPLDSYQDLSIDNQPSGVAQIHWPGGSAVLILQHNLQNAVWTILPLGYGLEKPLPEMTRWLAPQELFYLPHPPALQLHPTPTTMVLGTVSTGSSPKITLRYEQRSISQERTLQWNGERFALVEPQSIMRADLLVELNRLEASLFQQHNYRVTLDALTAFETRVRASSMPEEEKTQLLLEVFYHQALCLRKMGQEDRAAVIYAALARGYAENAWGRLAKQWVHTEAGKTK